MPLPDVPPVLPVVTAASRLGDVDPLVEPVVPDGEPVVPDVEPVVPGVEPVVPGVEPVDPPEPVVAPAPLPPVAPDCDDVPLPDVPLPEVPCAYAVPTASATAKVSADNATLEFFM